ncbi:MAG: hypothetical protein MZU84_01090 [Sphingobacterium sp.]|nr:hypothetical protein [Sphingobacterium sp.]
MHFTRFIEQKKQDSIRAAQQTGSQTETSAGTTGNEPVNRDKLGVFAGSSVGTDGIYQIENDFDENWYLCKRRKDYFC